jgi:hypothetical protein
MAQDEPARSLPLEEPGRSYATLVMSLASALNTGIEAAISQGLRVEINVQLGEPASFTNRGKAPTIEVTVSRVFHQWGR